MVNKMIKEVNDSKSFLDICDKLKDVPDCKLKGSSFYSYMIAGLYNKNTFTYANYINDKLKGCAVLTLGKDITCELTLFVVFCWIDPHYRRLWRDYRKFIEGKARELEAKKISFVTSRNEGAIERQLGKYGYVKVYSVIEKEVV